MLQIQKFGVLRRHNVVYFHSGLFENLGFHRGLDKQIFRAYV